MKQADITAGGEYLITFYSGRPGPEQFRSGVRARVEAKLLPRQVLGRGQVRDVVRVTVLEDGREWPHPTAGETHELLAMQVLEPWGEKHEERRAQQAEFAREEAELYAACERLGLPRYVHAGRADEAEEQPGVFVTVSEVRIDRAVFAAWLGRVDPVSVAGDAIDEFARSARIGEWVPADARDSFAGRCERVKGEVLTEVAQGLAVSDAELVAGDA